jgi:hypothetical protein
MDLFKKAYNPFSTSLYTGTLYTFGVSAATEGAIMKKDNNKQKGIMNRDNFNLKPPFCMYILLYEVE